MNQGRLGSAVCGCGSLFHGLPVNVNPPGPGEWTDRDVQTFAAHRTRVVGLIHTLNNSLYPPLYIEGQTLDVTGHARWETFNNASVASDQHFSGGRHVYAPTPQLPPAIAEKVHLPPVIEERVQVPVSDNSVSNSGQSSFVRRSVLDRTRIEEEKVLYLCGYCGQEYTWKSSVYRHVRTEHTARGYKCGFCHVPFAKKGAYQLHLNHRHRIGWCRIDRILGTACKHQLLMPPIEGIVPVLYGGIDFNP